MAETESLATARQIVRVVPLVMKLVNAELHRTAPAQDFSQIGLMRVLAHKGVCKMSVLADLWSVSLPTMSRSVRRLEERGWVRLSRTPEDRRQVLVELTPEGRLVLDESYDRMVHHVDELVMALAPEDQRQLSDGMDVLRRMVEGVAHATPKTLEEAQGIIRDVHKNGK